MKRPTPEERPVEWVAPAVLKALKEMPDHIRKEFGHALYLAQIGRKHNNARPLQGLGSGVLEVVENYDGDTYRAVYTVRYEEAVYVLHAFQKKSTQGIKTPQRELDTIQERLKRAEELHKKHVAASKTT